MQLINLITAGNSERKDFSLKLRLVWTWSREVKNLRRLATKQIILLRSRARNWGRRGYGNFFSGRKRMEEEEEMELTKLLGLLWLLDRDWGGVCRIGLLILTERRIYRRCLREIEVGQSIYFSLSTIKSAISLFPCKCYAPIEYTCSITSTPCDSSFMRGHRGVPAGDTDPIRLLGLLWSERQGDLSYMLARDEDYGLRC